MPLSEELGQCLEALLNDGFVLPIYFTCMAANGTMVYGRYALGDEAAGLGCDVLASYGPDDAFTLPINIIFVDHVGKAARVIFGEDGTSDEIQVFAN
jgi:hypothetical protein